MPRPDDHADGGAGDAPAPSRIPDLVRVVPWPDPVVEAVGVDPRSLYVERFWLPVLGPSATWLLRRLADRLDREPDGFVLDLAEAARSLGIGGPDSRHAPIRRALRRGTRFGLLRADGPGQVAVRRALGPVPHRQLARLPASLQDAHGRWEQDPDQPGAARRRARLLALDLIGLGQRPHDVERRLAALGVHPAGAYEAVAWASTRLTAPSLP